MEEFDTKPPTTLPTLSDVRIFKNPDRNYFTFVVLSVLLGFFGADHIYLRSFPTAIAKTIVNLLTLGLWYVWDILQIVDDGARIQKEGLNTPFDWVRGIGKGVFAPSSDAPPSFVAKKEYVFYAFLAICFGWLGADKFYMGEYAQGIVKLISCFNIFVFLFGWFWVAWDAYHAAFRMGDILTDGITPPLPYSLIFSKPINTQKAFYVLKPEPPPLPEKKPIEKPWSFADWFWSLFPALPTFTFPTFNLVSWFFDLFPMLKTFDILGLFKESFDKLVVPIAGPPVRAIQKIATKGQHMAGAAATIATSAVKDVSSTVTTGMSELKTAANPATIAAIAAQQLPAVPQMQQMPGLPQMPQMPGLPQMPQMPQMPAVPQMPAAFPTPVQIGTQVGGGASPSGVGPVLAGSMAALLLAGGAKGLYDILRARA